MIKLIRDLYKHIIEPDRIIMVKKGSPKHMKLLRDKLYEEVDELCQSDFKDITEFGDVYQVLLDIAKLNGFSRADIVQAQLDKADKLGGFQDGVVLNK